MRYFALAEFVFLNLILVNFFVLFLVIRSQSLRSCSHQDEKEREIRERIKEIPNMLKKADIRSRVTSALNGPKAEDSGLAK